MSQYEGISRREFVAAVGGATVGAAVTDSGVLAMTQPRKRRYAIVGTGVRGIGMWGRPIAQEYGDVIDFVGLCDINPLRVEVAKRQIGVSCPTYTNFDRMMDEAKPDRSSKKRRPRRSDSVTPRGSRGIGPPVDRFLSAGELKNRSVSWNCLINSSWGNVGSLVACA